MSLLQSPLKTQLKSYSQNFLSVLFSILNDPVFVELSDIGILRALRESDTNSIPTSSYQCSLKFLSDELKQHYNKNQKQENQIVKNLGGLYIVGTERNDSRRVDNQLRGRCGRQGDPGTSRFFLSLDDNLLRLFGGSNIQNFLQSQMLDDSPLESKLLSRSLDSAQQKVEERAYQQRKNLFEYDEVLNKQRSIIYLERAVILKKESMKRTMLAYGEQFITMLFLKQKVETVSSKQILTFFEDFFGKQLIVNSKANPLDFQRHLFNEFWLTYQAKINQMSIYGDGLASNLERSVCLLNIDKIWREHLDEMTLLREAVSWRGYGQQNPLYEYKKDALIFFTKQGKLLRHLVIYDYLRASVL